MRKFLLNFKIFNAKTVKNNKKNEIYISNELKIILYIIKRVYDIYIYEIFFKSFLFYFRADVKMRE